MNLVENPSTLEPVPDDYPGLKKGEVSTGTTIMAIPLKDGVILGADSRVSTGSYVANRVSDKIVQLSEHIFACRSGSAADTQALTDYVRFYLQQLTYVTIFCVLPSCAFRGTKRGHGSIPNFTAVYFYFFNLFFPNDHCRLNTAVSKQAECLA